MQPTNGPPGVLGLVVRTHTGVTLTKVRAQFTGPGRAKPGTSSLYNLGPDLRQDDGGWGGDPAEPGTAAILLNPGFNHRHPVGKSGGHVPCPENPLFACGYG
ncbi:hypothetical protein GCM10017621_10840 [Maricaulis virginensis]|uniref:Uncharacterized protein n=1 Tax=Maricaulis virginensis TaxID=144022 RepID=A0A9W6IMC0_9PROT|nr:hypothetical protein GCM10017621_10840 [Maricaulis virginensis]